MFTFLLFITFLLHNLCAHAQSVCYQPLPTQEQLPVANVNVILQDRERFMWYGTAGGGLCRDDGYNILTYSSKTRGRGLMVNDEITCIAEDLEGKIWFGSRSGAFYIDKTKNTVHQVDEVHVKAKKTNCIGVTADGHVWIGVQQNIVKFSPNGMVQKVLSIGNNKREEVKEMTVDSKGTLWITILRGGLATINPKTNQLTHQKWEYPYAASYLLEDTLRHCYWVGTWGGGIVRYPDMTAEAATLVTTERQKFGSEVYNMWIDPRESVMWVATMDDVYAYKIQNGTDGAYHLIPHAIQGMPKGKKLINKLYADRKGNIWVPGYSPHTFILSRVPAGGSFYRDEVKAMTEQMGYKIMVSRIAQEADFFWIYQNRTRLSLYHAPTGQLTFMANEALPEPLSTQKALSRCVSDRGVWTCNSKRLIHAWHEGMTIHWEEVEEATMPNYISALSDEGKGRLLIGTEKQVFLYDYRKNTVTPLTDSVGIVQQVASPHAELLAQGNWQMTKGHEAAFTTDPKAAKVVTDRHGHVWTLNELALKEENPKTGAFRLLHAEDASIGMDGFTDIALAGDSICLGGTGAFCLIGGMKELDRTHPSDSIMVTAYNPPYSISISTMNHLHTTAVRYAYRLDQSGTWTELPAGSNAISMTDMAYGTHTLHVKATDEYGVWHAEQEVLCFSIPRPWYLQWWAWCLYASIGLMAVSIGLRLYRRGGTPHTSHLNLQLDGVKSQTSNLFLQKVESFVFRNLDNSDYGVDGLCRDLGMSRMSLYRKFQSLSMTTPSDYIKSCRLKKAMELLQESTASVTEIAYRVGFSSPQYFAKCFKDEYGMTPREVSRGAASAD